MISEYGLHPVAALFYDPRPPRPHVFGDSAVPSTRPVCWVHPDDRQLLIDPLRAMGEETRVLLSRLTGSTVAFAEPDDVRELSDGLAVTIAGVDFKAIHAPGHRAQSCFVALRGEAADPGASRVDSVLFSEMSCSRSRSVELVAGGSQADMLKACGQVLPLPDSVAVLPGHGPQTTIAEERASNPYLQDRHLASA